MSPMLVSVHGRPALVLLPLVFRRHARCSGALCLLSVTGVRFVIVISRRDAMPLLFFLPLWWMIVDFFAYETNRANALSVEG